MVKKFKNAHDAYWFLYNHPKSVVEDPKHSLITLRDYESEGLKTTKGAVIFGAHKGKPRDEAYDRKVSAKAVREWWNGTFIHNLSIDVVKVNPKTNAISRKGSKNTAIRIWLETGAAGWVSEISQYSGNWHDPRLDVGAKTYEKALIKLAKKVRKYYGDY